MTQLAATPTRTRVPSGIPPYLLPPPTRMAGVRPWAWTVGIILCALVLLEVLARTGAVSPTTLPPVTVMVGRFLELIVTPAFYADTLAPTLTAIVVSFIIASIVGVVAGYIIWRMRWVRRAADPYLGAYYAIPVFALYPLIVAIWGAGRLPIILLATIFSIVTVILNSMSGYDSVPPIIVKLARSLHVSESVYFRKFFFPYAVPHILVGLRLAFLYALLSVLAAEFLLSTSGLGYFVANAYTTFNIPDMYAGLVTIFVIAILAERVITFAVRSLTWLGARE